MHSWCPYSNLKMHSQVSQAWIQYEALRILAHRHDEENQEEIFDIEVDIRQVRACKYLLPAHAEESIPEGYTLHSFVLVHAFMH